MKQTMTDADSSAILAVEHAAFERWAKGDLDGFLEASDPEVDYFDPFIETRMQGLAALREYYAGFPNVQIAGWEMIDPRVVVSGDMGVLTFNFITRTQSGETHWNTTEVYRRTGGAWRILHTHWSLTRPQLAGKPADQ